MKWGGVLWWRGLDNRTRVLLVVAVIGWGLLFLWCLPAALGPEPEVLP